MTVRQKEMAAIKEQIAKLKEQIAKLNERLEYLSKLPDTTIEDELLCTFDDFPCFRNIVEAIISITKKHLGESLWWRDLTVKDLISCKEEEIASHYGVGKGRMGALKSWMEKHNLHFVG